MHKHSECHIHVHCNLSLCCSQPNRCCTAAASMRRQLPGTWPCLVLTCAITPMSPMLLCGWCTARQPLRGCRRSKRSLLWLLPLRARATSSLLQVRIGCVGVVVDAGMCLQFPGQSAATRQAGGRLSCSYPALCCCVTPLPPLLRISHCRCHHRHERAKPAARTHYSV